MDPYRHKVGLYTLGVSLIVMGGAYFLRNSAYAYLWNPPVIGAGLLIVLGLEFIITKLVADHRAMHRMGVSIFSVIVLTLMILSLFGVGVLSDVVDGAGFTNAIQWGSQYQVSGTPVYEETVTANKTTGEFNTIMIDNEVGNVTLMPSQGQLLDVRASFYSERYRDHLGEQDGLASLLQADGSTLRLHINGLQRVDLTLYIPDGVQQIQVQNNAGQMEVSNLKADFHLTNKLGEVLVKGIEGNITLDTSGGKVEVRDINGDVNIDRASLGSVKIQNITGSASVATDAGDVTLDDIAQKATVRVSMGNATLRSIGGDVEAQVSTGNLAVRSAGNVNASVSMGNLEYSSMNTDNLDIDAHARFGNIQAASVFGRPTREATSQTLKNTRGDGSISVQLSANTGNITLKY